MRTVAAVVLFSLALGACAAPPVAVPRPTATASPTPLDTLAPTPTPAPVRTPPTERSGLPPACVGKPVPSGTVLDPCRTVVGVVRAVAAASVALEPDYGQEQVLGLVDLVANGGRVRIDLGIGVAAPKAGDHITAVGPLIVLADGAHALLPAYRIDLLLSQPPSVPPGVLAAREAWAQVRILWPAIPPAIIGEDSAMSATAAAALYPDGVAHLLVHTGTVPDLHTIFHEAGHILQAQVLRARGRSSSLYTAQDEVGVAYWSARQLPGSWASSLATGAWSTTGYEILAETFAAVNLGDVERATTYGVPLDRTALRAFFVSLVP